MANMSATLRTAVVRHQRLDPTAGGEQLDNVTFLDTVLRIYKIQLRAKSSTSTKSAKFAAGHFC
eukprot:COSAG01_NODE_1160_length_11460_cov_196.773611_4_plen_64_part_00